MPLSNSKKNLFAKNKRRKEKHKQWVVNFFGKKLFLQAERNFNNLVLTEGEKLR